MNHPNCLFNLFLLFDTTHNKNQCQNNKIPKSGKVFGKIVDTDDSCVKIERIPVPYVGIRPIENFLYETIKKYRFP